MEWVKLISLSDYRPSIHGEKRYRPLVVNALNIALVYCWKFYRVSTGDTIDQNSHRCQIVSVMFCRSFREERAEIVPRAYRVLNEVRLDGYGHYPEPVSESMLFAKSTVEIIVEIDNEVCM